MYQNIMYLYWYSKHFILFKNKCKDFSIFTNISTHINNSEKNDF